MAASANGSPPPARTGLRTSGPSRTLRRSACAGMRPAPRSRRRIRFSRTGRTGPPVTASRRSSSVMSRNGWGWTSASWCAMTSRSVANGPCRACTQGARTVVEHVAQRRRLEPSVADALANDLAPPHCPHRGRRTGSLAGLRIAHGSSRRGLGGTSTTGCATTASPALSIASSCAYNRPHACLHLRRGGPSERGRPPSSSSAAGWRGCPSGGSGP